MPDFMMVLGHNGGPPLVDPEALNFATETLRQRAANLGAAAERAHATDADTVSKCLDLVKMIGEHAKRIEEDRKARKEPFLSAGRAIDAFYKGVSEPLDEAKKAVTAKIDAYRKANGGGKVRNEYGAVAHDKTTHSAEVTDARAFALWLLANDADNFMVTLTCEAARCIKQKLKPDGVTVTPITATAVR